MGAAEDIDRRATPGRRSADVALDLLIGRLEGLERRMEAALDRLISRFDKAVDKLEERFDRALIRFESRVDELEDVFEKKIAELEGFHLEDQAATRERVAVKTEQLSRWQKWAAAAGVMAVGLTVANFVITLTHSHH